MIGWLDILLAVILLAGLVIGLIKGLVKELVGLAAVLVGFFLAARFYRQTADFIWGWIRNPTAAKFLGFMTVFLAVVLVGGLAAWLLSKLMRGPLAILNHVAGGAFGLLEGALVCGVVVFALLVFPVDRAALSGSRLAPYCYGLTKALVSLIPRDLKDEFGRAYQDIVGSGKSHGQKI
jgi:membrane protein required for colicin V production